MTYLRIVIPLQLFVLRMIFSDLPSPAEALIHTRGRCQGFAQAGNRYPLFGIMRYAAFRLARNSPIRSSAFRMFSVELA